jgi:hypothetical protein
MIAAPLWAIQLSAGAAMAEQPAAAQPFSQPAAKQAPAESTAQAPPIELSYLTDEAFFAVLTQPRRVLGSPEFELLPVEVLQAAMLEYVGIDAFHVEQVLLMSEPPEDPRSEPVRAMVVRLTQAYSLADLLPELQQEMQADELNGRLLLRADHPSQPNIYMPDDTTLILAQGELLSKMLDGQEPPDTRLAAMLAAAGSQHDAVAVLDVDPIREMILAVIEEEAPPLPEPLEELKQVPTLLAAAQLEVNLTGGRASRLELVAVDDDSAGELERILNGGLDFGRQMALMKMEADMEDPEAPIQQAALQYARRISQTLVEVVRPQREGDRLALTYQPAPGQQAQGIAAAGVLVALLLPAVNAARAAARRTTSMYELRQLGLALMNYEAVHGRYPSAGGSDEERPGLSWRVHMLPYIEENQLYEQFHLDEPWDSEHNLQLVEQMPALFATPSRPAPPGQTYYQLVVGEGTAFNGGEGPRIRDFTDGTSNTVLLVEADDAVTWTKPDDWEFDPDNPFRGLGHVQPGGIFLAVFCDVHAQAISLDADPDLVRALFTHQGDEVIEHDALSPGR